MFVHEKITFVFNSDAPSQDWDYHLKSHGQGDNRGSNKKPWDGTRRDTASIVGELMKSSSARGYGNSGKLHCNMDMVY